jgi:hypothetical protein
LHAFTHHLLQRLYIVGHDPEQDRYHILKLDRRIHQAAGSLTSSHERLQVTQDATAYTKPELDQLLLMVHEGNKAWGGLKRICHAQCLIG